LPGFDDLESFIGLPYQEKTNVRSDPGAMEIYHEGPVKIRPQHLSPVFTPIEPLKDPQFAKYIPPHIK
jgi:hypothetical protein